MRSRRLRPVLGAVILASTCVSGQPATAGDDGPPPSQAGVASADTVRLTVELAAVDSAGKVPEFLAPADLAVTVGGRLRTVAWIRRVSRGPGAVADAAARRDRNGPGVGYVAEPRRVVLLVIDEGSLPMGGERPAIEGAAAFLDRLGMNDRVAVVRLPLSANARPELSPDRPVHRDAINRIAGQIPPEGIRADGVTPDSSHVDGNPMGARINREERADRPEPVAGGDAGGGGAGAGGLDGLVRVLRSVSAVPGRKVVAFFSSGLDDRSSGRLATAARAAAEARASLYVFSLPVPRDPRFSWLDPRLLTLLARTAGGAVVTLGRNPAAGLDALAPELDACFQLGILPAPDDAPDGVRELRVESRRSGLVVRAPAFVALRAPVTEDLEPPPTPRPEPYRGAGRLAPSAPPAGPAEAAPEADPIVGRLRDYVQAYIAQYSAVVAEEDYRQSQPREHRTRRLRSDLLFVRSGAAQEWISFRDVYEVDGNPVRDRDTRLQDLFLTPKPDGQAQLQSIKDESARYNIGSFERNINVPLFPLKIVAPAQREHFTFSLGRAGQTAGVKTWRLDYVERGRPTMVRDREGQDIPLKGYFLLEQATGALVESAIAVERQDYAVSIVVRYAKDPKMGIWVPAEMKENYTVPQRAGVLGVEDRAILTGTARYSNFRRFQVTTDTQIVPKK